mgnify:CR=1 FL=1
MADLSNEYIRSLQERANNFDYDAEQKKYADRLSQYNPQPENYDIYDLATSLSQGLSAQQQTNSPNSIGGGLALGFNQASQDMKQSKEAYAKAKREIGLQAATLAMQNEKEATKYLDKSLYELAKASMGVGNTATADIKNYEYRNLLDPDAQAEWDKMKNQDPFTAYLLQKSKSEGQREGSAPGGVDLTPTEKVIDENFGKIAAEYVLNGAPQIQANLLNLSEKIRILEAGEINVSGKEIGLMSDSLKGIFQPEAASFIGDVRDIVFQSLREKLGAQFTENEGNRLVAAAFNSYLSEEMNIARLQRLYATIEEAARSKQDAINYFDENRTLQGYKATPINFDSILSSLVDPTDFDSMTDEEIEGYYENAGPEEQEIILQILRQRAD